MNNFLQIRKLNEDFVGNIKLCNIVEIVHRFSIFIQYEYLKFVKQKFSKCSLASIYMINFQLKFQAQVLKIKNCIINNCTKF